MEPAEKNERDRWIGPKWLQDLFDRVFRTAPVSRWNRAIRGDSQLMTRARELRREPRDGSITNEAWWEERVRERQQGPQSRDVPLPQSDLEKGERADAAGRIMDARLSERIRRNE